MATRAGALLTEAHRLAQAKISAEVVADLLKVWPLLDPRNLDATVDRWLTASQAIVLKKHGDSAALAREYLRRFRAVELGTPITAWTPPPAPPAPIEAIRTSLVVQGPVRIKAATAIQTAIDVAAVTASGTAAAAGSRHALNGGRDTIVEAAKADERAQGMRRVTSGTACKFCSMLATRTDFSYAFKAHDGCHCQTHPVYR